MCQEIFNCQTVDSLLCYYYLIGYIWGSRILFISLRRGQMAVLRYLALQLYNKCTKFEGIAASHVETY